MTQPDLTTLANVKSWLNLSATSDDLLLGRLITAATGFIGAWCDRDFSSQTYTETRDGTGTRRMMFADYPVTEVTLVTIHGRVVPPSDGQSVGYVFDCNKVTLIGEAFPRGLSNICLTYVAGYQTVPMELEQAAIELVAYRYRERDRIGHASKTLNGETVAFITKDMPNSVATLLQQYRRVVPL